MSDKKCRICETHGDCSEHPSMTQEYEKAREEEAEDYAFDSSAVLICPKEYDAFKAGADFSREWHMGKLKELRVFIERGQINAALYALESLGVK